MIQLDLQFTKGFLQDEEWLNLAPMVRDIHARLHKGDVPGKSYLGWLHLPSETLNKGLVELLEAAEHIRNDADVLVVIGIGGSYLGTRAAFEWLKPAYYNQLPREVRKAPEIYFAGNHLSGSALHQLLKVLEGKRVYINVISKSGTTTEPAVAFRVLRQWLIERVGVEEARKRIFVTTDGARGALLQLAAREGLARFVIPDDVGGRYSVLTPVGLLPLAAIGVDIQALLAGAADMEEALSNPDLGENPAYRYAAIRNALYRKGKTTEVLATYEPSLLIFAEWWKQLFGESEGKNGKGVYPASVSFTTDLHSMGQYIQEGYRNLFETVVRIDQPVNEVLLPSDKAVDDGLEYLSERPLSWVNDQARLATQLAHSDGGVPNLLLSVKDQSEHSLGQLFYFFELACAASGLLMGVNPFDQPGVEAYKSNMFALLGKPGYTDEQKQILARLQ